MFSERADKKTFLSKANEPVDFRNLSDLERTHLPVITAPERVAKGHCFEVQVHVGKEMEHLNDPGHSIQFIELYADEILLNRVQMISLMTRPRIRVHIVLQGPCRELKALAYCNRHGLWLGRKEISVKDLPQEFLESTG
jgi:superoxide reductase